MGEANPGDMTKDMESVFANAEETAKKFQERMEAERKAREAAAKDIVAGLGGNIDESGADPLSSVAESIESILASIVSDKPEEGSDCTSSRIIFRMCRHINNPAFLSHVFISYRYQINHNAIIIQTGISVL